MEEIKWEDLRQGNERYLVYDFNRGELIDGVYILDPRDMEDRRRIKNSTKDDTEEYRESVLAVVDQFEIYSCVQERVCPDVSMSICCAHCAKLDECRLGNPNLCGLVEIGEVLEVSECYQEV